MVDRLAPLLALLLALAAPASSLEGVVLLPDGSPAADATVSILGLAGSTRTGPDGRFTWVPDPPVPFEVLVVLAGGMTAPPVLVESLPADGPLTVQVQAAVNETVTVRAGATPHTEAPPASAATLLGRQELEQHRPANLTEALDAIPGAGRIEAGHSAVPTLRGLGRGRTLILIDGARVTAERRAGPSATFLDPFFLEAVEVSRGFGSVAYGSDAFGGIIHARTRRVSPGAPPTARIQGTLGAGIPERAVGAELTKGLIHGGLIIQGRFRDFDDYRSPQGRVGNSAARDYGFRGRFDREFGPGVLQAFWETDSGRNVEKPASDSDLVRAFYPREDSHRLGVGYEPDPTLGFTRLSVHAFLGWYRLTTDRDTRPTALQPREVGRSEVRALDYGFRATAARPLAKWRVEGGLDLNGRMGLEALGVFERYDASGNRTQIVKENAIANASRHDAGLYAATDGALNRRLTAAFGARLDRVGVRNVAGLLGDHSFSRYAVSGFAALTAGPLKGTTLTAQVGSGFREPTLSDRYFRGVTGRGSVTGSPDLEPERSLQYDLALRRGGRVRAALYLYRYRISDLVERFRSGPTFFFRNRGRAVLRGVEAELQADLGWGLNAEVGAQASSGQAQDDDADLDDVPARRLTLTLNKAIGARGSARMRAALEGDDDDPGPTERPIEAYATLEATAAWRWSFHLETRLVVKNVFDRAYLQTAEDNGVLAPGRSAALTVSYIF